MNAQEKLDKYSVPEPNSGCVLWLGTTNPKGYGRVYHQGRTHNAHRLAWETKQGPIPEGLTVDHLCRVRSCVNIGHMEIVPNRINVLRGVGLTAINASKAICKRGHDFTPENTHRRNDKYQSSRDCRACRRIVDRRRRAKERLQRGGREEGK